MPCHGCGGDTLQDAMKEMGVPVQRTTRRGPFLWRSIQPEAQDFIRRTLDGMVGTPYQFNQRVRGVGFDCRTSIAYFLDMMEGRPWPTPLPEVAQDAAVNDVATAARVLKVLVDEFGLEEVMEERVIEPGDIIGVREETDGHRNSAHGLIAGVDANTAYHAPYQGSAFCKTSLSIATPIVAVYRPRRKDRWR